MPETHRVGQVLTTFNAPRYPVLTKKLTACAETLSGSREIITADNIVVTSVSDFDSLAYSAGMYVYRTR
jgi:hypothetical protein